MNVTPFVADRPPAVDDDPFAAQTPFPGSTAFGNALDRAGSALTRADRAEDAFAAHAGSLQDAVFERAQADVLLAVATAAAQRTAQSVQSLLNMQI